MCYYSRGERVREALLRQLRSMDRGRRPRADARALHEAAHVLVGVLLGWRIRWVRVYDHHESSRTGFDGGVMMLPPVRSALAHRSAVRLAGGVAEALYTDRNARQIRDDSSDDWEQLWAADLTRSHHGKRVKFRAISRGSSLARRLIVKHSEAFAALAEAIGCRPVSAGEAHRIIGDGHPSGAPRRAKPGKARA